jgi:hypothetical protein
MDNNIPYRLSIRPLVYERGLIYHWIILSYPSRGTGIKTPVFGVKNQKKD